MRNLRAAFTVLMLGVPVVCVADAVGDSAQCARIADDASRLACYDGVFGRPADATKSVGIVSPAAPVSVPAAAAAGGAATFGLSPERTAPPPQEIDGITATVASVGSQAKPGRWTVTLDNGQVWEQRETTSDAHRPRPGDTVKITKASLGSYLLSAPNRGLSRVRRVK